MSGNINMDISCFFSLGGLYSDAYLRGDIAFGVANKRIGVNSLKEIQGFYENGWWGTQEVITALADWKLTNTLGFISPEITLTGAQAYGEIESLFFQNHFLVRPLPLYTSAQRHTSGDNWSKREHMSSTRQVQSRVHGGFLKIDSRSSTTIISAILSGNTAEIPINAPLEMLDSFDTYSYTAFEESKKKKWYGGTRKTSSSHHFSRLTPVPTRLDFQEIIQLPMSDSYPVLMRSVQAENSVMEFIMDMTSVQENNPPQITLETSYTEEQSSSQRTSSGFFRTTSEMERRLVRNYLGCQFKELKITILNNPLNIKPRLNIQTGSGQIVPAYVTSLQHQEDIALIHIIIQNIYQHEHKRHSALSGPFKMVLGMAVSALIPGLGTSLGMVMLKAGLTCMGTNAVVSLGEQGNLRGMTSRENLRGLATTVATAGLSHMIAEKLGFMAPKGEANILTETPFYLAQNVVKSVIQSTLQTIIERNGKFGDNLVRGLKTAAIETGNVLLTRQIGRWVHQDIQVKKPGEQQTKQKKEVNPILHRAAHFTVGAGTGYLLKANPWMAGANQVVGEEIGSRTRAWIVKGKSQQGIDLRKEKMIDVIKFITSVGTFLSGGNTHDICAGTMTSGNAAQHNALLDEYLLELYKKYEEPLKKLAEWLREQRQQRGESCFLEATGEKIQKGVKGFQRASGQYWRKGEFTPQAQQMMKFDPMGYMDSTAAWSMMLEQGGQGLAQLGHYMATLNDYMQETRHYYENPSNHVKGWNRFNYGTIVIPMGFDTWDVLKAFVGLSVEIAVKKFGGSPSLAQDMSDIIDPLMFIPVLGTSTKMGTALRGVSSLTPKVSKSLASVKNVTSLPPLIQKALPTNSIVQYGFKSEIFAPPVTWMSPVGTKQTYRIYQRTDINWNMLRTEGPPKYIGKTNIEAALEKGHAPQIGENNFVRLHHINQDARGPLIEAPSRLHTTSRQETFRPIHNLYEGNGNPEFPVNRSKFNADREKYWKERAKNEQK